MTKLAASDPSVRRSGDSYLEDRCAPRMQVEIAARMRWGKQRSVPVTIRDISISGIGCSTSAKVPAGSKCWIYLPGVQTQEAELVWRNGCLMGFSFQNLLPETQVSLLAARYRRKEAA